MARRRMRKNKSLPPNLYFDVSKKMYRYRRPDNGKSTLFGKDKTKAVTAAKKLNSLLMEGEDFVAKVMSEGKTLSQYIKERFIPVHLPERELAKTTLNAYLHQIKYIHKHLGGYPIHGTSIKSVSDFLSKIDGARQSNKYRGLLCMIFDYARGEGYIDTNPANGTLKRREKKKRTRLKLEQFKAIYNLAGEEGLEWFQDAMYFNLIILQRREEIAYAKFKDIKQEIIKGKAYKVLSVIQKKTKKHGKSAHIKIIINEQLEQFIEKRKNIGIPSPFIIHRIPDRIPRKMYNSKYRQHHTQILPDELSRTFAKLRDKIEVFNSMKDAERPTFHEIRSLAIKLHDDKKDQDAQALAGHTTRQMTEAYKAGHEIEWTYAEAAKLEKDLDIKPKCYSSPLSRTSGCR